MKKVLQSIVLLLGVLMLPATAYAQDFYGDVNGDGTVNITDVNHIINIILAGGYDSNADVNSDGQVNITDLNVIIDIILNPPVEDAVVHVYGDDGPTEGSVVNVTDGTVTITCDPSNVPKPSEIIVSGVADNAPVGFLRRVESVQATGGQYVITTTNASLEEALPDGDYDLPVPMEQEGQYVTIQAPGQPPQRVGFSTTLKLGVKIGSSGIQVISDFSNADVTDVLEGKEDKTWPVKIIAQLTPSLDFNFIYNKDQRTRRVERIGLKGNADITADIMGKLSKEGNLPLLGEDGVKLFTVRMRPVTVMAGYVPIVFTPRIDVFLTAGLNGEVYLKSKFVAAKASGEFRYVYTRTPDPLTGQNHNFTTDFSCSTLGDGQLGERFMEVFAPKVGVNGALTVALKPTLDVSLYGANDIFNVGVPISPWVKAEGNLALKLEKDIELDYDDQIIISGGVDIGLSAKFKLGKANFKWEKDVTLFETQLLDPIGITPRFADFMVSPGSPIPADTKQVRFSMDMTKPYIQLLPDQDYGFTYGFPGESRRDSWTFISEKGYYDSGFTPTQRTQYMESYVGANNFMKDKDYRACPYVTIFGINVYKKGANFSFKKEEEDDWVDLGLPSGVIWATCNIGASSPEDYGSYFAWDDTTLKEVYNCSTYKWGYYDFNGRLCFSKYKRDDYGGTIDSKTELNSEDDAANANRGSGVFVPSIFDFVELIMHSSLGMTWRNGEIVFQVTGPNGNSIFFPAAGYRWNEDGALYGENLVGIYWTSNYTNIGERCFWRFYSSGSGVRAGYDSGNGSSHTVRVVRMP